jgi:hypothetical protein
MTTTVTRIARFAAISVLNLGFAAGLAAAEWTGPRVVGTGENNSLDYPVPSTNIVGGATYRVTGSGEGASIEVIEVQRANPGRLSRVVRSGESAEVVQIDPLPPLNIG